GGDNGLYGTGWDWIVWSFEQARKYFPNSKLLINDYNVLCDNYSCIDTYLKVINILKDRKLIDGIGCQSHGLENSNPSNIKQKLDRLGATGIPVYISEFDLNIADDTTQKNKMQSIFSVFYQHSAVKGITLWGYLQGHTWITNSYLIRNDGSERPALTWLRDYMKSQPDVNTEPVDIDAFTQIEAENYNDQSGIQTETCTDTNGGQNIGFIENGDYAVYKNVVFGTGATSFQARVASNNANGGKIEIRLDSASGTLVGTCAVAGTGGWQTYTDVKCSVSGVSGKHDLYLVFTGGSDYLFNMNWFKFLKTTSTIKYGDLDGNGGVDALDFALMKQYMLKLIKEFPSADGLKAADVDGSGGIDALDFALVKQYLLKMIDKFPAEK
ncbi:MAG TPA: carbohydrate-binding protein, partial [Clostridia bacterium]|nr:carbohydrate-binding protein [Clostridia bacterium]